MDAIWFGLDEPHQRPVVTAVVMLTGDLDVVTLRSLLRTRLVDAFPRFASRMRRRPVRHWQRVPVDLDVHVTQTVLPPPGDDGALAAVIDALIPEPLDLERPLWHVLLVHGHGNGSALVWRIHHSLGDGSALVGMLLSLTEGAAQPVRAPSARTVTGPAAWSPQRSPSAWRSSDDPTSRARRCADRSARRSGSPGRRRWRSRT